MKSLLMSIALIITIGLVSCQKKSEGILIKQQNLVFTNANPPALPQGSLQIPVNFRINAVLNPIKLGVNVYYTNLSRTTPVQAELIKYEYVGSPKVLQVVGTESFTYTQTSATQTTVKYQSNLNYTGAVTLNIKDSVGVVRYSNYMLLTDSTGWTVNLDTLMTLQTGLFDGSYIRNSVPKHY